MKKKWIVMGAAAGISAVMLTVSAMSAMAGTSGYDAWKSAFKQTKTAESISGRVSLTVTDNGTELVNARAAFKKSGEGASAAVTLQAGGAERGLNAYLQNGKAIVKTSASDVYYVMEHGEGDRSYGPPWMRDGGKHEPDPAFAAGVERVIDALAGNLKDHVTLKEQADGGKQVSLLLSGNQVPLVANAIGSLLLRHASSGEAPWHDGKPDWAAKWHDGEDKTAGQDGANGGAGAFGDHPFFADSFKPSFPKLTDDIRVEAINLDATIDPNNDIDEESVEIRISGKDEAGSVHNVVVHADIDLYDVNATTPDTVDLTGKQVEMKTMDSSGPGWHRGRGGR
jgi:hypothetical protein